MCQGSCGDECHPVTPYGCPCICDWLEYVKLPTVVAYTAPESVYGSTGDSGFGASQYAVGNYSMQKLNAQWVLNYGYGVTALSCKTAGPSAVTTSTDSINDSAWLSDTTKGVIEMQKHFKALNIPEIQRSKIDDRLYATSWTLFYRALQDTSSTPESFQFSTSPYSSACDDVTEDAYETVLPWYSSQAYENFGSYLNRFDRDVYDEFESIVSSTASNEYFDSINCSDEVHTFEKRPVYFVWEEYSCCILSGQVEECLY
jgi:hypothetical protein